MKIIDLLNKIANGEVPKKIKVDNKFIYIHDGIDYKSHDGTYLFDSYIETTTEDMNIEIEIVEDTSEEEKKIPEKLEDISEIKCVDCKVEIDIIGNKTLFDTDTPIVTEHCIYKINQLIKNQKKIIDYLKSKGE